MGSAQRTFSVILLVMAFAGVARAQTSQTIHLNERMFATPAEYLKSPGGKLIAEEWGGGEAERLLNYDVTTYTAFEFVPNSVESREGLNSLYVHLPNLTDGPLPQDWKPVFERTRTIFVSLNGLVELGRPLMSLGLMLDAIATERRRHNIDANRVVVGGAHYDALVAVVGAITFPDHIAGSISHGRSMTFDSFRSRDSLHWGGAQLRFLDSKEVTLPAKGKTRFAFVGGERHETYVNGTFSEYEGMLRGVEQWWWRGLRTRIFDVPGLGAVPAPGVPLEKALVWALSCSDDGSYPPRFESDHWPPFTPIVEPNAAPVDACSSPNNRLELQADAGPDLTLEIGQRAVLDGYLERAPRGVSYAWESSGTNLIEGDAYGPAIKLLAQKPGRFTLKLIVSSEDQRAEDTVVVTVKEPYKEPVAKALPPLSENHCAVRPRASHSEREWPLGALFAASLALVACSRRSLAQRPSPRIEARHFLPLLVGAHLFVQRPAGAQLEQDVPLTARLHATTEAYFEGTRRAKEISRAELSSIEYSPEEITATRYIPTSYPNDTEPYALYVHVDSGDGFVPDGSWQRILDEQKVLLIAPNAISNDVPTSRRMSVALDAMATMQRDFRVDPNKIIIGGLSGGGAVATHMGTLFPQYFVGVISHARPLDWTNELADADTAGAPLIIRGKRFAFISGENDWVGTVSNYGGLMESVEQWWFRGIRMRVFDVPGMGHAPADAEPMASALRWVLSCYDDGRYRPRFETLHASPNPIFPRPRVSQPPSCDQDMRPVALAHSAQTSLVGDPILLDGSRSFDPDGGMPQPLTFQWTQTGGPAVELRSPKSSRPSFTAEVADTYSFSLITSDGATTSEPVTVTVVVEPVPPAVIERRYPGDMSCSVRSQGATSPTNSWVVALLLAVMSLGRARWSAILRPSA